MAKVSDFLIGKPNIMANASFSPFVFRQHLHIFAPREKTLSQMQVEKIDLVDK